MKKFLLIFFSFLFFTTATVGGGLLLSGCNNSSYSETNGGGNFDNSENKDTSNVDVDNDNSNSDNPEAMAGEQRYCWFAGTIFVKNKPSSYYDSNSGDPEWGIMREGNHQQVDGCYVEFQNNRSLGNYVGSNGLEGTTNLSFLAEFYNSSTVYNFRAYTNSDYVFDGWWCIIFNFDGEGGYSQQRIFDSTLTRRVYGSELSRYTSSSQSSADDYLLFAVYVENSYTLTINYNNRGATNTTNLRVSTNLGTLSSTTLNYGSSVVLTSSGTASHSITITPTNSSYDYYIGTSSTATTVNTFSYSRTMTSNASLNIYVYQRYEITYNPNGGSGSMSATYKRHGTNVTLRSNSFTRANHSFAGWATSSTGSVVYSNGATYTSNANATLYAKWTLNEYTVTYNANGGTMRNYNYATRTSDYSANYGGVQCDLDATTGIVTLNGTMTANFEIVRYFTDFSAGNYNIGWKIISGSMTRTAGCFAFEFYTANNQGLSNRTVTNITSLNTLVSGTLTLSEAMAQEAGMLKIWVWYDGNNGGGYTFNNLKIRLYTYLNTPAISSQQITYGTQTAMPYATRTGYTFTGWNTIANGTGTTYGADNIGNITANTTLYAQWEANTYTVTWNGNATAGSLLASGLWNYAGSSGYTSSSTGSNSSYTTSTTGVTATSSVTYNSSISYKTPIPIRSGYTFNGWYTATSGGTRIADSSGNLVASVSGYTSSSRQWIRAGNTTLYAQWSAKTYSITYNLGGGSLSSQPTTYSVTTNRTISTPTRTGYTFTGWSVTMNLDKMYSGQIDQYTGVQSYNSAYPNAVYYEMFYMVNGIRYTGALSNGVIRFRAYYSDGTYSGSSGSATNTGLGKYAMLWYHLGNTNSQTQVTFNLGNTSFTTNEYDLVGDLEITANWEINQYSIRIYAMTGINDITRPNTGWYSDSIGRYKEVEVNYNTSYTVSVTTNTGYEFNRWTTTNNSEASASSTSATYTFTVGAQDYTLYAWGKAETYTVTFNSNGGSNVSSITVTYNSVYGALPTPTREGFNFDGWYFESTLITQVTSSTVVTTVGNHTLYAKWEAINPAQYDEENGYWYVEMGYYPQTRATETEINGITNTNGAVYTINGTDVTSKIGANSIEYCQYNGVWYKVEPVRYVLSGNFSSGYGTEEGNYLAVTEKVVFVSAWSSTKLSLGDGYTSSTLRTNISDFISDTQMNIDYTGARSYTIKNFRNVNGASADTTLSVDIVVSNDSEIESIFGDLRAEFSDLVSDILGNNLMYWTRDVGSNLNTAECISSLGASTQTIMQKTLGVRLTANVSIFGCL